MFPPILLCIVTSEITPMLLSVLEHFLSFLRLSNIHVWMMNPAFLIETCALLYDGPTLSAGSAKIWKQMQVCRFELRVSFSAETSQENVFFFLGAQQSNLSAKSLVSSCPLSFFWGLITFGSGCMFVVDGWFVGVQGAAVESTETHTYCVCLCVCDCDEPAQGLMEYPWRHCCPPFHSAYTINNCTAVRLRHGRSILFTRTRAAQTHAKAWVWTFVWGNLFDWRNKNDPFTRKTQTIIFFFLITCTENTTTQFLQWNYSSGDARKHISDECSCIIHILHPFGFLPPCVGAFELKRAENSHLVISQVCIIFHCELFQVIENFPSQVFCLFLPLLQGCRWLDVLCSIFAVAHTVYRGLNVQFSGAW